MGSDRARVSFDPSRKWRGLVAQQGRVTVEADWNEAAAIDAERDRLTTLAIIGPVGTPDGGYAVTPVYSSSPASGTPESLTVGKGTLFLGGVRLELDTAVDVNPTGPPQADWLDQSPDSLWLAPVNVASPSSPPDFGNQLVYLLAIEQEVSALEDATMTDVALGGPDTMQRLRILQHFVVWETAAAECAGAWQELEEAWEQVGLMLDNQTMRFQSATQLSVGFDAPAQQPNACQPAASGGYLGPENQLIRVQVASVDRSTGTATVVWGFDDASFIYKLDQLSQTDLTPTGMTVTLTQNPVDSYHYPVAGQTVELLRDAALVSPTDVTPSYVASATGFVATVAAGTTYDATSRTLSLSYAEPPEAAYTSSTQQPYLRVWQGQATVTPEVGSPYQQLGFTVPIELENTTATTGLSVTMSSNAALHAGDFWRFAVRPTNPQLLYPARIGLSPQPPDGPRVWACPIAFVAWSSTGDAVVTSCVPTFENLTDLRVDEAVTLSAIATPAGVPTLFAWFHLGEPVNLPSTIQVTDENGAPYTFTASPVAGLIPPGSFSPPGSPATGAYSELWALVAPAAFTVANGAQLSAFFPGTTVQVGSSSYNSSLASALNASATKGNVWVGEDEQGGLTTYTSVPVPLEPQQAVTLGATATSQGTPTLSAWFHLPGGQLVQLPSTVEVFDDQSNNSVTLNTSPIGPNANAGFSDVWALNPAASGYIVADGDQLSVTFPGTTTVGNGAPGAVSTTLALALGSQAWLDADPAGDVTAYATVTVPYRWEDFVTVTYVPTPVTVSVKPAGTTEAAAASETFTYPGYLELWFHMQPSGAYENIVMSYKAPALSPYLEILIDRDVASPTRLFTSASAQSVLNQLQPNVFQVPINIPEIVGPNGNVLDGPGVPSYLRLLFDTQRSMVGATGFGTGSLDDWIKSPLSRNIQYVGSGLIGGTEGDRSIVAFARVVQTLKTVAVWVAEEKGVAAVDPSVAKDLWAYLTSESATPPSTTIDWVRTDAVLAVGSQPTVQSWPNSPRILSGHAVLFAGYWPSTLADAAADVDVLLTHLLQTPGRVTVRSAVRPPEPTPANDAASVFLIVTTT